MSRQEISRLYDYNAWANHRVLDACGALDRETFVREMVSSFPSVRDTLVHILGAEWIWLERWRGRSPGPAEAEGMFAGLAYPDLEAVRRRWQAIESDQLNFIRALREAELGRVIEYINLEGHRFAYPLREMLVHLVNHGSYHRGQVVTLLRQMGAQPAATDYLRYLDVLAGDPES